MSKEHAGIGARALVKTLKLTKARENFIKNVDEVPRSKEVKPPKLISSKLEVDAMMIHSTMCGQLNQKILSRVVIFILFTFMVARIFLR